MDVELFFRDDVGFIFWVGSESDESVVYVVGVDVWDGWFCSCEDYQFRKHRCKHIRACLDFIRVEFPDDFGVCDSLLCFVEYRDGVG